MFKQKSDFTLTFRRLSETLDLNKNHFISMFKNEKPILNWYNIWKKRLEKENNSKKKIFKEMTNTNPLFIPRNHIVDRAIKEATEKQSFSLMNDLLEVLQKPFDKNEKKIDLSRPPELSEDIKNTFCGT